MCSGVRRSSCDRQVLSNRVRHEVYYGPGKPPHQQRHDVSIQRFRRCLDRKPPHMAQLPHKGDTIIGSDVWIGRESIVMPGVKIGDGAIIAAYSVVVKDVPAYTVYGGNPARFIKERFDAELKDLLLRYQWWNLEPETLVEILPLLCDPDLEKLRHFLREQLTD